MKKALLPLGAALLLLFVALTTFAASNECGEMQCIYIPAVLAEQSVDSSPPAPPPPDTELCPIAAPTLVSPVNGSILNTLSPRYTVDVGDAPEGDYLRAQVARDAGFATVVENLDIPLGWRSGEITWQWTHNLTAGTTYYWRAWFECGAERTPSPYSETWSFATNPESIILVAPTLIAPADGSTVAGGNITFQWEPVDGAAHYWLKWRPVGTTGYQMTQVFGTEKVLPFEAGHTYEWWVVTANSVGVSPDSEKWHFTTTD